MKHLPKFAVLALSASLLAACGGDKAPADDKAQAEPAATQQGTLDKIKQSGTIVLAHRDSSIPFSYIADNPNQPVGYAHDLQLKVVEALKKRAEYAGPKSAL